MKPGLDHIGVGVGAILLDEARRVLLLKRGPDAKNERGLWEFPGGAVDLGETRSVAIVREVREELNINIVIIRELITLDHLIPSEKQHWITTLFLCKMRPHQTPQIQETKKHVGMGWFDWDEMPGALSVVAQMVCKSKKKLGLDRIS